MLIIWVGQTLDKSFYLPIMEDIELESMLLNF